MHLHHDHIGGHSHDHEHTHTHEHTHDGVAHTHEHTHEHAHDHSHPHEHDHLHGEGHTHDHSHDCAGTCGSCGGCQHTPMEELLALMKFMVSHNDAHAQEVADLARELAVAGKDVVYDEIMDAVSDFDMVNAKLAAILEELNLEEFILEEP